MWFCCVVLLQRIKSRLDELDKQAVAINKHVTMLAGIKPVDEEEVSGESMLTCTAIDGS